MKIKAITILFLLSLAGFTSCKKSPPASKPVVVVVPPVVPPVVEQVQPEDKSPAVGYDGYDLAWSDEFNATSIDMLKWNFESGTGVNGDFGTGQLDRATDRAENGKIESSIKNADGGSLAITTRREAFMDRQYTSARLNTSEKGAWGPGYRIEARVWAKDIRYKGQGFAFWMMPAEKPAHVSSIMWPQGGEIDIMEYVGSIPNHNLGSVHYAWFWENNQYKDWNHGHKGAYYSFAEKQVPAIKPEYGGYPILETEKNAGSGGFHIYGIDWFADRMEFRLDNNVYHIHYFKDGFSFENGIADGKDKDGIKTIDGKRVMASEYSNHFAEWSPFEHKFYVILTAGVGGKDNQTYGGAIVPEATFPCSTYIDWVRVYKRK